MRRALIWGVVIVVAGAGVAIATRNYWSQQGAVAQAATPAARGVTVEVGQAESKLVPLQVDALGTVTPVASVAIKSRLDNEITDIRFSDGARVKKGDVLLQLDTRAIEAQVR